MKNSKNILLENFDLAPFLKVKNENYLPAFKELIEAKKKEINSITSNSDDPTFKNTIEALEFSGEKLDRVSRLFFNINSSETSPEIQKIAQEVSPLLSELGNDITLNNDLFLRVKNVYDKKSELNLSVEKTTLLDMSYKSFLRNGANLDDSNKEILRKIDKELSLLRLKFSENVLAETNNYELHLTNLVDLKGLSVGEIEAAAILAKNKGKEGWLITLAPPSFIPFMKYAENRELRKTLQIASGSKCFKKNEFNNEKIVLKIAKLRYQRANLLNYKTHSHFVLEERMAGNPETVSTFLNELLEKAKPFADKEFKQLEDLAKELDGLDHLEKWDYLFYLEKLKNKLFNLDDEKLKPYFKLENVIQGAFTVAEKLYELSFIEVNNIDTYHKDVKTYEVKNKKNELVSIFYADFHPREGKKNGAWMDALKNQKIENGKNKRPHIINVCNFTSSTDSQPSLLTFNEVTTLFHEFGHGLHGMLANTTYPSLSGTSVYGDFVELPSQILENWCYEKECLDIFAKHYKTGESIPMEFVKKIKEFSSFMEGMSTVTQIRLGLLDMSWHGVDPTNIISVKENESQAIIKTIFFPDVDINCISVSFSHIFFGGYSSGYYSYKWAEVLDADAFEYFKENGIFNPEIGKSFADNILSKGGTEHPMKLYKRFRGQEPKPEALLIRSGLVKR
ncbi:MAG: M3 family metallopeptidase [Bacteroidota bacterium]|nr:M3 family metallopeptidase [Bacteroidota bacterium]